MTTSAPATATADAPYAGWRRLHPLSPVPRFGSIVLALVLATSRTAASSGPAGALWIDGGIGVLAVAGAVASWLVTRWRIDGEHLQIELGLIRRQSLRVPVQRLQAIDVVRPLVARVVGLAEVRLVVAGAGEGHSRLAYLSEDQAWAVRARLLALAHGLAPETPEPGERPLWQVRSGRLAVASLLSVPVVLLATTAVLLVALAAGTQAAAGAVLLALLPALLVVGSAAWRRFAAEFEFTVAVSPDGLRLKAGLLQTRAETVPFARIQGVRLVQPLLWRLWGWQRLELDVARQKTARREASAAVARALCPVGLDGEVRWLLDHTLPGASAHLPPAWRAPRRAAVRAPLLYRSLAVSHDERFVATRRGRLRWHTTLVPLEKVQSIRWSQGPLQRSLRLASVEVDTAGRGWRAVAQHRDADEAQELVTAISEAARAARRLANR